MRVHTTEDILRASAAWVWFPRDSDHVNEEVQLVRYPARFGGGVRASQVRSSVDAASVLDHAIAHTRDWGEVQLTFWTSPSDSPDLEDELRRRGAEHIDTVAVLASAIDELVVDVPDLVTAEIVRTLEQVREVDAITVPVWEQEPLDEDGVRVERDEVVAGLNAGRDVRVLGRLKGRAVSTGGCTIVDGFARLWGAATLPDARGQGVYRAVLAERLRAAVERGATTAVVKGRVATSAPILRRVGFRHYGDERAYRLVLAG
ncbi:GNAT family N-acetyltransferase [Microbacterium paraoxydans]|uniref:GNAT family N-acetyltransferase n=1 Tax=Microbacterium paraoxydans TaxID=199592 RepID=UPI001CF9E5F8|nr:GNAT family N-acetyltransferase [Microbacterium paraoxydans]